MPFWEGLGHALGGAGGAMAKTFNELEEQRRMEEALAAETKYRQDMIGLEGNRLEQSQTQFEAEQRADKAMNEAAIKERRDTASDASRAAAVTAQNRYVSEGFTGASLVEDDGFFSATPGELDQAAFEQTPEFMLQKQREEGALNVANVGAAETAALRVYNDKKDVETGWYRAASQGATTATEVAQAMMNMGVPQASIERIMYEQMGEAELQPSMMEGIEGTPQVTGFSELSSFLGGPPPMDPDSTTVEGAGVTSTTEEYSPYVTDSTLTTRMPGASESPDVLDPEFVSLSPGLRAVEDSAQAAYGYQEEELQRTPDWLTYQDIGLPRAMEFREEARGTLEVQANERATLSKMRLEELRPTMGEEQYQQAMVDIEGILARELEEAMRYKQQKGLINLRVDPHAPVTGKPNLKRLLGG